MLNDSPYVARPIKVEVVPEGGVARTTPEADATAAVPMSMSFHARAIDIFNLLEGHQDPRADGMVGAPRICDKGEGLKRG